MLTVAFMTLVIPPLAVLVWVAKERWDSHDHKKKLAYFDERLIYLSDKKARKQILSRKEAEEWNEIGLFVMGGGSPPDLRKYR